MDAHQWRFATLRTNETLTRIGLLNKETETSAQNRLFVRSHNKLAAVLKLIVLKPGS